MIAESAIVYKCFWIYLCPIEELAEKGLYVELGAYQRHVFLDFRVVVEGEWKVVAEALNGAGVESARGKWEEMVGEEEEEIVEIITKREMSKKDKEKARKKKKV